MFDVFQPHVPAAKRVATMCYSAIGCKTDKAKAHQFYTVAANAGDAEALNALGINSLGNLGLLVAVLTFMVAQ